MTEHPTIQPFINNFRRRFSGYLAKGIGVFFQVYPSASGGAVLEIALGADQSNRDEFSEEFPSVNEALKSVEQTAFGGNLDGFNFGGTNIIMEPARILLVKADSSADVWTDEAAKEDVARVMKVVTTPQQQPEAV